MGNVRKTFPNYFPERRFGTKIVTHSIIEGENYRDQRKNVFKIADKFVKDKFVNDGASTLIQPDTR